MPIPSYILPSAPAYTEDSVYALIPTPSTPIYTPDAISFTRGSDATRTASNGLIQRSPWNLLQRSEEFENVIWGKLGGTTVTANQTTAPNGTNTADLITEGTSVLLYYSTLTPAGTYTQSWYLKKGTGDIAAMYFGSGFSASYNLTLGTILTTNNVTATITNVGDGWYRCTATATPTASFYAGLNYSNSSGLTIYAWGAQLVEGSQPLTYFPTTDRLNVPRIDFSQGSCPALLLEPQRTNLALYSEQFDSATWTKNASATITANSTTAPDGNTNADTLTVAALTFSGIYRVISGASANYTVSIYAKKDTKNWLYIVDIQGSTARAWFNLNSGVLGTVASGYSATITSVGNGWYRCTLTNTTALSALYYQFGLSDSDNSTTPTSSGSAFIYGAQIEVGSYATTYIPTTTTSVTRLADIAIRTGISSLIGQTQGTIFFDVIIGDSDNSSISRNIGGISDGTGSNRIEIYRFNNTIQYDNVVSGVVQFTGSIFTITNFNTRLKVAISYSLNNVKSFVNGVLVNTDLSALIPACSEFGVGTCRGILVYGGHINQTALFKTALSDANCITMTT
jgi:hypothetical protein